MFGLLAAAITVTTSFEGGNIGRVEHVASKHLRCAVEGQSDQNHRNRQANWYYFRLDNVPGQEIRMDPEMRVDKQPRQGRPRTVEDYTGDGHRPGEEPGWSRTCKWRPASSSEDPHSRRIRALTATPWRAIIYRNRL